MGTSQEDVRFAVRTPRHNLLDDVSAAAANKPNVQIPKYLFSLGMCPAEKGKLRFGNGVLRYSASLLILKTPLRVLSLQPSDVPSRAGTAKNLYFQENNRKFI